MTLPASTLDLWPYIQLLAGQTLLSNLQSVTFGHDFNRSLNGVTLPSCLESISFGHDFDQNLTDVKWPSGPAAVTLLDFWPQLEPEPRTLDG